MMNVQSQFGIHSTAGAVPVRNEKGEVSMQKVKVQRYISGKRPEYAQYESSDDDSESDDFIDNKKGIYKLKLNRKDTQNEPAVESVHKPSPEPENADDINDPRLRRLTARKRDEQDDKLERHRHIHEPEILETNAAGDSDDPDKPRHSRHVTSDASEESESEEELSDEEIERRRQALREKLLSKKDKDIAPEVLVKEDEKGDTGESDSESYEEYTDSEEETAPRLKPVFVRRRDRITLIEREREEAKQKQLENEIKRMHEERKRQTVRMVEDSIRKDMQQTKNESNDPKLADVNTDDENDELEFESWKLRELKRIKRDREERDRQLMEKQEIERLRGLTEEERKQESRSNPKIITNKATKGKYKFLQKYYHRGAFYLDNEETVFKQDFSGATLDDHFDKTVLPKVMQVKNFGRSGRTKYTHLVDQDTTQFDSPWIGDSTQSLKFMNNQAAGMKQIFEKPTMKKNTHYGE